MTVASPFQDSRRASAPVVLTYTKQRASLTGLPYHQRRRREDWQFLYKIFVFGSFLTASCLYISHQSILIGGGASSKLSAFLKQRIRRHTINAQILLHYQKPHKKKYARTVWTMDEFFVNGVNLATFGFEEQEHNKLVIDELFELNEDFDISHEVLLVSEEDESYIMPSTSELLLHHRHLEHPSLAFYMDKIAQKHYHQAIGIPVPQDYAIQYKEEWQDRDDDTAGDDKTAIEKMLPQQTDFVVKASHQLKGSSIRVSYDQDTKLYSIDTKLDVDQEEDSSPDSNAHDLVATQLAQQMHQEVKYTDPWALLHAQPGVLAEESITAFDSPHRPGLAMQVYVIWGRVWMASWPKAEGPTHPGMIHRNGTVVMDDHVGVQAPDWVHWDTIVAIAEDLGQHKDLFQVNVLVGVDSETAHMLQHSRRQEQLAAIQVYVTDVKLDPDISFYEKELLDEMGRLWLAGYEMGIFRTIKNPEVPVEFIQHQKLTAEDAEQPHILGQWTKEINWKSHSDVNED